MSKLRDAVAGLNTLNNELEALVKEIEAVEKPHQEQLTEWEKKLETHSKNRDSYITSGQGSNRWSISPTSSALFDNFATLQTNTKNHIDTLKRILAAKQSAAAVVVPPPAVETSITETEEPVEALPIVTEPPPSPVVALPTEAHREEIASDNKSEEIGDDALSVQCSQSEKEHQSDDEEEIASEDGHQNTRTATPPLPLMDEFPKEYAPALTKITVLKDAQQTESMRLAISAFMDEINRLHIEETIDDDALIEIMRKTNAFIIKENKTVGDHEAFMHYAENMQGKKNLGLQTLAGTLFVLAITTLTLGIIFAPTIFGLFLTAAALGAIASAILTALSVAVPTGLLSGGSVGFFRAGKPKGLSLSMQQLHDEILSNEQQSAEYDEIHPTGPDQGFPMEAAVLMQ